MQSKISVGSNFLLFPQDSGSKLPAPAGFLREAIFSCHCSFYQTEGLFLFYSTKQSDPSNHLLPLKSMVSPTKVILFRKRRTFCCWLLKVLSKKIQLAECFFTIAQNIRTTCCQFFTYFHIYRVKKKCQAQ